MQLLAPLRQSRDSVPALGVSSRDQGDLCETKGTIQLQRHFQVWARVALCFTAASSSLMSVYSLKGKTTKCVKFSRNRKV